MRRIAERLEDMHAALAIIDVAQTPVGFGVLREAVARFTQRPTSDARVRAAIELAHARGERLIAERGRYRLCSVSEYADWLARQDARPPQHFTTGRRPKARRRPQQLRLIAA